MRKSALFILVFVLSSFFSSARAAILLSDNFDELTAQLSVTSVGEFSAINGTDVDIVGPADGFGSLCATPESGNCVDMDGSVGNSEGVLQSNSDFTLTPGNTYTVSFNLVGSQRGNTTSTTVTFGPYSQVFNLGSSDDSSGIVSTSFTVDNPTSSYLTFTSNTPGFQGAVLDNVSITSNVAETPEPATLGLFGLGLLGILTVSRKIRVD